MSETLQPKRFRQFVIALCKLVQAIYRQEQQAIGKPADASARPVEPGADQQQLDAAAGRPARPKSKSGKRGVKPRERAPDRPGGTDSRF